MNKNFFILSVIMSAGILFAQNSRAKVTERQKIIYELEQEIPSGDVLDFLRKCDFQIQNGIKKGENISFIKLSRFATAVKIYIDYRWFVADTGLSKKWMEKIYNLLAYMNKTKRYMQTAEFNGRTDTEKYKKAVKYFLLAYKRFNKLIRKPVRADSGLVQSARNEKSKWRKAMRKKYNIKKEDIWN